MNKVMVYGGLGNQMFQYAFNTALNQKGNQSEIFFYDFFYDPHHNGFDLGKAFLLKLPFPLNLYSFILVNGRFFYRNKLSKFILSRSVAYFQKKKYIVYNEKEEFIYDEKVFSESSKLFIGTWQVEKYFSDCSDIIREKFIFKNPKDKKNKLLSQQILESNSVSIHVRRGDYLTQRWAPILSVIKDNSYYIHSINYINDKIDNPHYFIFSDDIKWAKENLKIKNSTFVEHNKGDNAYIDMYLMSHCKHNIIANSTFSWWAAWLNINKNKIVIMPSRWLNLNDAAGVFPSGWIKMQV